MPLVVESRCARCKEAKTRDQFPSRVVGKTAKGTLKRVFSAYCWDCVRADPKLWTAFGQQLRDIERQ